MNRLANILANATAAMEQLTPENQARVLSVGYGEGMGRHTGAQVHITGGPIAGGASWEPYSTGDVRWTVTGVGLSFFGLANPEQAREWGCPAAVIVEAAALEAAELAAQEGAS